MKKKKILRTDIQETLGATGGKLLNVHNRLRFEAGGIII